jgi:hypothetical protein
MVDTSGDNRRPSDRGSAHSRRKALQQAAAAALLSLPGVASAGDFAKGGAIDPNSPPTAETNQIKMTDLSYTEVGQCPKTVPIPQKGGPWSCIEITATATNVGRRKDPAAANVFGTMFDADLYSPLAVSLDPTQKFGIQVLPGPFPQNKPREVKFTLAVQGRSKRPFKFALWKANYIDAGQLQLTKGLTDCEQDEEACTEDELIERR